MTHTFTFDDDDLHDTLCDMAAAELLPLPNHGKHQWVIACAIARRAQSPPPVWAWLLMRLLDQLLPFLVAWLKDKYGDDWATRLRSVLAARKLPWQRSDHLE